jgi:Calx-beta domain
MKNFAALILSITLLLALGFAFSSCKDDEPPAKPKLSFAETEISVDEDDGMLEVELTLDKPYSKDLRIEYELGGTASDQDVVGTTGADYEVVGDHGVVEIESGETTGVIKLDIYGDAGFEPDETIVISIMDTNTDEIELTADDEAEVTIKNDDEQLTASFANTTSTVNEDDGVDGVIQIPVQLDKPAAQNVTITYTLDGSAWDSLYAFNQQPKIPRSYYDYYAKGTTTYANGITTGQIVISSGQTSGNIELQIYTDFIFENDETIEIQLTASNDTQVGTNSKMTITLEQQDGKVIALVWDESYTDVDMDMFLWIGETADNLDGVLASAINASTSPQELIFIPKIVTDDISTAAFGLSCVYYSGTADPMNFEVHYVDFTNGALEAEADRNVFSATYTLTNINQWDQNGAATPAIVQTFNLTGGVYSDFTDITVPSSGSRIRTHRLPAQLQRHRLGSIRPL